MSIDVAPTSLDGVVVIQPARFADDRGWFEELFNLEDFGVVAERAQFVQDNHSRSRRNVLRGLHYQLPRPQGKLVGAVMGRVWDVAVDLRRSSATFGSWYGTELSDENGLQLWIPPGFAHGFLTLSEWADVLYKTTEFYVPEADRALRWDDPDLEIDWPLESEPLVSPKDAAAPHLADAEVFE